MASGRIGDVGEKIGKARKDEHGEGLGSRRGSKEPDMKSKLWPRPDFRADALSGKVTPEHAAIFMAIYRNLPSIPFGSTRTRAFDAVAHFEISLVETKRLYEEESFASRKEVSAAFDAWAEQRFKSQDAGKWALGKASKRRIRHPFNLGFELEFVADGLPKWGWPWDDRVSDKDSYGIVQLTTGEWRVCKGAGRSGDYVEKIAHRSEFEAAAACAAHVDALLRERAAGSPGAGSRQRSVVKPPTRPDAGDISRFGPCWRAASVAALELKDKFGFRGIEFGNWVTQAERQELLDATWDALMDLTETIGLPPRFASLGGRLAIAFGSRGKGLGGGAAHYEPDNQVLHFTRESGAGAVAHEFGHALDHYLAHVTGLSHAGQKPYLSHTLSYLELFDDAKPLAKRLARPGKLLHNAIRGGHLDRSTFYQEARKLDRGKRDAYWATPHELFARAFEAWVADTLKSKGRCNPYLVHGVSEEDNVLWSKTADAYPSGQERQQIFAQMDNFIWEAVDYWTSSRSAAR